MLDLRRPGDFEHVKEALQTREQDYAGNKTFSHIINISAYIVLLEQCL